MSTANKQLIRMVELAVLTAVVIILQLAGVGLRLPFLATPVSLVLLPITLGAMILGSMAGAWLGLVFGVIVFVTCGVMGLDSFTVTLFQSNPFITACICIFKSTLAGLAAGWLFSLISKKNSLAATFAAAAVTPIINTGLFIVGCFVMFDVISGISAATDFGANVVGFVFIGCAGINFIFEMIVNLVLASALHRIYCVIAKQIAK